jgi:hypothetical protein
VLEAQATIRQATEAEIEILVDRPAVNHVAMNEYRFGTAIYTTVITTQQTALGDQETALQIQENRLLASVKLIADLGGGWDVSQLPSKNSLQRDNPLVPSFLEKHARE